MIDKQAKAGEYIPPAFPQSDRVSTSISIANSQGMTLRDYFAAKAMQGWIQDKTASSLHSGGYMSGAIIAYQMADAMLKVRNENN